MHGIADGLVALEFIDGKKTRFIPASFSRDLLRLVIRLYEALPASAKVGAESGGFASAFSDGNGYTGSPSACRGRPGERSGYAS